MSKNPPVLHPPIDPFVQICYPKQLKKAVRKRRRGTAIVDTPQGVLIVAGKSGRFLLPGGAAEKGESRKAATIRELQEETTLKTVSMQFLFSYRGHIRWRKTGWVRDEHKVFLVQTEGTPQPTHEIRELKFYQLGDSVRMSEATRAIIDRYLTLKPQLEQKLPEQDPLQQDPLQQD
ncbi:NUDIX domain-containing protein [Leptolyngbya ohadii]|uniref:NUDIX domain-containing protein n=1 Tax=Leptolyngbya ohadii TaxID=1962290 RepID=UPI000B598809|nr:NUDIX domain-containing protein [Leptolyngbya ohadii]